MAESATQRLHGAVVLAREVARVERQQEDREDARDEPAQSVYSCVPAEPLELARQAGHLSRR